MTPHLVCPMLEVSQIGDARRQAARLAARLDFDELATARLALVVTELATNLVRHARDGLLLVGIYAQSAVATIELIAVDGGPGIPNVEKSMADGVSTAGTSGNGLGAIKRTASQLLIYSKAGYGTIVVARLTADSSLLNPAHAARDALAYAGICVAAPGELVSGDGWASRQEGDHATLLVADGLGHGPDAAAAADAAAQAFLQHAAGSPRDTLERCHLALRSTRGAAVAVVQIDLERRILTFCGAGNVAARLISGTEDRSLMSQHGTVGLQVRRFQEIEYNLPAHAILVAHTDGILTRWDVSEVREMLSHDPIVLAAHLIKNKLRGKDDATVVVVQCG